MVRKEVHRTEMQTTYLLKPGQTIENTRPAERTRALVVSKSAFKRLTDHITEKDRIAEERKKETEKTAMLRKAAEEKTKAWDKTIKNIKAARREELLSKKQKAEDERKMFVQKTAEKKAVEREKVVKQARRLLLQKKPLCRRINSALLAAECFRELNAQIAFQKTVRAIDQEREAEYADFIKTDVAKYEEQKRQEAEARAKKTRDYRMDLKKQIEENEQDNELKAARELEAEKQEQINMRLDMQLMKEKEMQHVLDKKEKLQQLFKEVTEEKKRFESELKRDDECHDRVLEIYQKAKDRIKKIEKSVTMKEREERARLLQIVADQYRAIPTTREDKEREILEKVVKEREATATEQRKAQKEREKMTRAVMEEFKLQHATDKAKRRQEQKELKDWEMMQRFKRDEYDKRTVLEERKRQMQQKLEYGKELRKDAEEKQVERKRDRYYETEGASTKAMIDRINQRILHYGDEVLKESEGVRPTYPIAKAIEGCKKEMGLVTVKKVGETVGADRPRRRYGVRRICTKPLPAEQIHYFR